MDRNSQDKEERSTIQSAMLSSFVLLLVLILTISVHPR
jgi:hypothetical protein